VKYVVFWNVLAGKSTSLGDRGFISGRWRLISGYQGFISGYLIFISGS
jgi:hypothetical protein